MTTPDPPAGRRTKLGRVLASPRRAFMRAAGALLLGLLVGWALWYNEHRPISWRATFSPTYWWKRYTGQDLFDPSTALLTHGNRRLAEAALTFDDGPHPESLPSILATLRRFGVHATFFDVGKNMRAHPDLVLQTLAAGDEVGNHSNTHPRLNGLSREEIRHEINDVDILFCAITGGHLHLFRPPGMDYNARVLRIARSLGYVTVSYTCASKDFLSSEPISFVVQRTLDRTEDGSIILLHDYPDTAAALPAILTGLKGRGIRPVTVSQLITDLPSMPRKEATSFLKQQGAQVSLAKIGR